MPAVLFLLKAVFLILMWGLVLAAVVAVRHDIFGTQAKPAATPAPRRKPSQPAAKRRKETANKLVVTEGPLVGTSLPLAGSPVTIGRADDSTLVISDDYVSTRHARLLPQGDAWLIEDLGSTNGTFLDRQKVTAPTLVPIGVPLRIGKTVLELRR